MATPSPVPNLDLTPQFPGPINRGELPPEAKDPNGKLKVNLNYFRCIARRRTKTSGGLLQTLDELGFAENNDGCSSRATTGSISANTDWPTKRKRLYDESMRIPAAGSAIRSSA